MKIKRSKKALTDLVGIFILLSIAISLFTIVNIVVFTYPFNEPTPSVNLIGSIDEDNGFIIIKHNYGDSLDLETKIIITMDGEFEPDRKAGDYLDASEQTNGWNIGETVIIDDVTVTTEYVEVTVVDIESNSVIMMADLQKGTT